MVNRLKDYKARMRGKTIKQNLHFLKMRVVIPIISSRAGIVVCLRETNAKLEMEILKFNYKDVPLSAYEHIPSSGLLLISLHYMHYEVFSNLKFIIINLPTV